MHECAPSSRNIRNNRLIIKHDYACDVTRCKHSEAIISGRNACCLHLQSVSELRLNRFPHGRRHLTSKYVIDKCTLPRRVVTEEKDKWHRDERIPVTVSMNTQVTVFDSTTHLCFSRGPCSRALIGRRTVSSSFSVCLRTSPSEIAGAGILNALRLTARVCSTVRAVRCARIIVAMVVCVCLLASAYLFSILS